LDKDTDQSSGGSTQDNNNYSLPAWFLENRVQAHVRYTLKMMKNNPEFRKNGNKILKDLGANVITRHLKSADEGAWWPTKYGKEEPQRSIRIGCVEIGGVEKYILFQGEDIICVSIVPIKK